MFKYIIAVSILFSIFQPQLKCKSISESEGYIEEKVKITVLYDNYDFSPDTKSEWGFSCLIEGKEKTILMDTGGDAKILQHNMKALNIDPAIIDVIVITHEHWDHIGGLNSILEINPNVTVYLLPSFTNQFIRSVERKGADVVLVNKPMEICKGIHTTGEMGARIKEQSLVIETAAGSIITTGCSHPGITSILKKAKEIVNDDIYITIGGFHLKSHSADDVEKIINDFENLGVIKCGATHCTGDSQLKMFKEAYKENYISVGSGNVFRFTEKGLQQK